MPILVDVSSQLSVPEAVTYKTYDIMLNTIVQLMSAQQKIVINLTYCTKRQETSPCNTFKQSGKTSCPKKCACIVQIQSTFKSDMCTFLSTVSVKTLMHYTVWYFLKHSTE